VLDTATCNVARHDRCAPVATLAMPAGPFALALNRRTDVLYSANLDGGSLSLIDTAHCNATDTSSCATPPKTVALDGGPIAVAVDPGTDTVYVSRFDAPVAVLHSAQLVGTLATPGQAGGLVVDRATHTLYIPNWDFDVPGRVSVVDTRVCNGLDQSGCGRSWPTTPSGRAPIQLTLDPATHRVFSANFADATLSVIDGASCNALSERGCARVAPRVPIGNIPFNLGIAVTDRTVYTANAPDREVSVIDVDRPCRAPVRCER
jgi:DNA-binding beta-propeller fold protein YncE